MSKYSNKMLDLLQQISVLKELDSQPQSGIKNGAATPESKQRQKKRKQIHDEIKDLAFRTRRKPPNGRSLT